MTLNHAFRGIAGVAAVTAAMFCAAGAALAHPAGGGPGPGGNHEMIGRLIADAKAELKLNTMQQGMFDAAVASSKAARESARALHGKVREKMRSELAKPEPDLAAVAAAADAAREQGRLLWQGVRNEWLALYAQLGPEQKAIVRERLQKRLSQGDAFRQRMHEHMHRYRDGAAG